MLKRIINLTLPILITIGTLLVAFGVANINGLTVISQKSVEYGSFTWNYYYFDTHIYINNLENALNDTAITGIIPEPPQWNNTPPTDILTFLPKIINALTYSFNWIIYALNWLLLAPLKILLYPINILISLFGFNTSNDNYIKIIQNLYNWQLPYIPSI